MWGARQLLSVLANLPEGPPPFDSLARPNADRISGRQASDTWGSERVEGVSKVGAIGFPGPKQWTRGGDTGTNEHQVPDRTPGC